MRRTSPRVTAIAMAGLALTGIGAMTAAPAMAAIPAAFSAQVAPAANPALINAASPTELLIHKKLGPTTGDPANGTAQTVSGTPLQNVNFDVYDVYAGGQKVDLKTNAGWKAAAAFVNTSISASDIANGKTIGGVNYTFTQAGTVTTGATGTAQFDGVVGLYVVKENLASSTGITDGTKTYTPAEITPSPAFAVTLPMTNPDNLTEWMYTVNVYPKNSADTITKQVIDKGLNTGDDNASPAVNHGNKNGKYVLTSTASPVQGDRGTYAIYDNLDSRVSFTGVESVTVNGTALDAADYVVYVDGAVYTSGDIVPGAAVTVALTPAAANALPDDAEVVTTLLVNFDNEGAGGVIPNGAGLVPSTTSWEATTGTPGATFDPATDYPATPGVDGSDNGNPVTDGIKSNVVESKFGDLLINKFKAEDNTALANTVFSVYWDGDQSGDCDVDDAVPGNLILSGLTTDANGQVTAKGLQVSDFNNGVAQADEQGYCLVETKAANGYNLNAEAMYFTIANPGATNPASIDVFNEKSNLGNALPLTGGAGAVAGLGGLLLVGGAMAARGIAAKRRKDEEASPVA